MLLPDLVNKDEYIIIKVIPGTSSTDCFRCYLKTYRALLARYLCIKRIRCFLTFMRYTNPLTHLPGEVYESSHPTEQQRYTKRRTTWRRPVPLGYVVSAAL